MRNDLREQSTENYSKRIDCRREMEKKKKTMWADCWHFSLSLHGPSPTHQKLILSNLRTDGLTTIILCLRTFLLPLFTSSFLLSLRLFHFTPPSVFRRPNNRMFLVLCLKTWILLQCTTDRVKCFLFSFLLLTPSRFPSFPQGIWRIPVDEIDRPGSFASHMNRSIVLLLDVLSQLRDHDTLLRISLMLQRTPEQGK